jgi:uncharacterized glyoxalase superfamily protein PhnB
MQIDEVFPYLCVKDAERAIEFYREVFGATEKFRLKDPESGKIGHVELEFGKFVVMLSDEFPDYGCVGPSGSGPTSFQIHLHVDNADEVVARAVKAGATVVHELKDKFYGERSGTIRDPFGHQWNVGHHLEDVKPEDMQERYDALGTAG